MQIGLSSIVGDGFGFGSFVFGEVPSGFPAYGTFLFTATGVVYPEAEGGLAYQASDTGDYYPIQDCDVDVLADGSGGQFYDWTSETNVDWLPYETFLVTENDSLDGGSLEVPTGSNNYFNNGYYDTRDVYSDGNGGVFYNANPSANFIFYTVGQFITFSVNYTTGSSVEVPTGSATYFDDQYDGAEYTHDGTGDYDTNTGQFYFPSGTFIYNDGTSDYYWDGMGGYYA